MERKIIVSRWEYRAEVKIISAYDLLKWGEVIYATPNSYVHLESLLQVSTTVALLFPHHCWFKTLETFTLLVSPHHKDITIITIITNF